MSPPFTSHPPTVRKPGSSLYYQRIPFAFELPVAEVSACSKQAQSPRRVSLRELMLQGNECSLSLELWAQFPQLNPFTSRRDSVLSW